MIRNRRSRTHYRRSRTQSRASMAGQLFKVLCLSLGFLYLAGMIAGAGAARHPKERYSSLPAGCIVAFYQWDDLSHLAQCPNGAWLVYDADGIGNKRGHGLRKAGQWAAWDGCIRVTHKGKVRRYARDDIYQCLDWLQELAPYQGTPYVRGGYLP
jgi:hypothetical protein